MIRVGALAPLSPPGLVPAGRDLRAGLELAAAEINASGGLAGEVVELLVCDSRGEPSEAVAAVDKLARAGVVTLVGEFHSVVADAVAARVEAVGLPFVCSSATLDALTARRPKWLFRIAPPQAYGWRVFADFLAADGRRHVALAAMRDVYWDSGARVLEQRLSERSVAVTRVDGSETAAAVEELRRLNAARPVDAVLMLVGYPSPLREFVAALRAEPAFDAVLIGDPAGRAAFADWADVVETNGTPVPYLCYIPSELPPRGQAFVTAFVARHRREPTFVAFEGYDSLLALAPALASAGGGAEAVRAELRRCAVSATRGVISFTTEPEGVVHQQWKWPPVAVVAGEPGAAPSHTKALYRPEGDARTIPVNG